MIEVQKQYKLTLTEQQAKELYEFLRGAKQQDQFSPFNTKDEAVLFIGGYKMKYTTQGFITRWTVQALCEVL